MAWDVFLLYGDQAEWKEEEPPQPDFWMHQLFGVTKAPRLDQPKLKAKLQEMLEGIKTLKTTQTNDTLKVEFLYFKDCPSHKAALANLKAALRASGAQAELALINVTSEEQARKLGFLGSPSIRVNGKDLEGRSDAFSYGCRIYRMDGKVNAAPTKQFIEEKLKQLQ